MTVGKSPSRRDCKMAKCRSYRFVTYVRGNGTVTCAEEFEFPFESDLQAISQGAASSWNRQRRRNGGVSTLNRIEVWREDYVEERTGSSSWVTVGRRGCWAHWCDVRGDGTITFRDMRDYGE